METTVVYLISLFVSSTIGIAALLKSSLSTKKLEERELAEIKVTLNFVSENLLEIKASSEAMRDERDLVKDRITKIESKLIELEKRIERIDGQ